MRFSTFLRKFVIVFFDDILVYSSSVIDHIGHLELVFDMLSSQNFYIKLSKCSFCQDKIEYLGHIVTVTGVQVDPQILEAMVHWPVPLALKQLRGFLGLPGYYWRFIAGYASIVALLTDLLCHDAFFWSSKADLAVVKLKEAMTVTPRFPVRPDWRIRTEFEVRDHILGLFTYFFRHWWAQVL